MFGNTGCSSKRIGRWIWLGLLFCNLSHGEAAGPLAPAGPVPAKAKAPSALEGQATGQGVTLSYLEGQVPVAPDALTTLGTNLFGDKVNLFNGSLEFEQSDLQLPGNNALPVEIVRRYQPGRRDVPGQFGDWDLETPRIGGVFALSPGWVVGTSGIQGRCSDYALPPVAYAAPYPARDGMVVNVNFIANDYHQGVLIAVPGMPRQEVLRRSPAYTAAPSDGRSYPLVTRDQWQISCLPNIQNGSGEGFVALSPQGVRYRFDWISSRLQPDLLKDTAALSRREIFLHATEVTDRYGNWVRYSFDPSNPMLLTRIQSSDGRVITINNVNGLAASVSDGTRTLAYRYANSQLSAVERPDGSRWTFDLGGLTSTNMSDMGQGATCENPGSGPPDDLIGTMTHPSGASGRFRMNFAYHGRTYVDKVCRLASFWPNAPISAIYPKLVISQTLMEKTITGPGLPTLTWTYQHGGPQGWNPCTGCADRKGVLIKEPNGQYKYYEFGVRWRVNEGQLLRRSEGWTGSAWLRTTDTRFRTAEGQAFPDQFGISLLRNSDFLSSRNRPQDRRVTAQQGTSFTWEAAPGAAGIDASLRPLQVSQFSSLGFARSEATAYRDHPGLWVMGQIERVTDLSTGLAVVAYDYHPVHASKMASYAFGRQLERFEYNADGTLQQAFDSAGRATHFGNYKRGIAQIIIRRDGTQETADVNNLGALDRHTNAANSTHRYAYDAMGRLARIDYPAEASSAYLSTNLVQGPVLAMEYGLAPGHWRQVVSTGNATVERYYDALWRLRMTRNLDAANPGGTSKVVESRYDHEGRKTFESYPQRNIASVDGTLPGTRTVYDALARVTAQTQDSELGTVGTVTEYLPSFLTRTSTPRGHVTQRSFQAFDEPGQAQVRQITAPEGVTVSIERDVFGKPLSISRSGNGTSATRSYAYDAFQRLCKTVEPEAGATVQAYDPAGNVAWRAGGLSLTNLTGCDESSVPEARKVTFNYDTRDRLLATTYGDGSPGVTRSYTADGLLAQTRSANSIWTYSYNNRRVLIHEQYTLGAEPSPGQGWNFHWGVDALGNVDHLTDPWGAMAYAPNALGQPTQVSGYASGITHHPNGAVAGYTLNNGITHSLTQNLRGLPWVSQDSGVTQDRYSFDANGNVAAIEDLQENTSSRSMGYDGLDRLTAANGPWGGASFGYDALDNLRNSTVGGRSLTHNFDANNRLSSLTGSQNISIGYDLNGNVTQRGAQAFNFDIGNRMLAAPGKVNSHIYDGHGRRSQSTMVDGNWRVYAYGLQGKLLFSYRSDQGHTRYVYLGDKLIAETQEGATTYSHTDALGSPVAKTNSIGSLVSRTRYEPYGATVAGSTNPASIGFTGHVNDADTGLVYMQQRYYDPISGRFLSVDPVVTDAKTGGHFNRYLYAENNPYRYRDPDGRAVETPWDAANVAMGAVSLVRNVAAGNYVGAAVDAVGIVIDVAATATPGVPGGAATAIHALRTADKVGDAAKAAIPKPGMGKGSVPPGDRDPKRLFTREEVAKGLEKQGGDCAGCGK